MDYRSLGQLRVSSICLGTMTWGEQNTEAEAFEQMDYALEQGVMFWDTAEVYPVPIKQETAYRTERAIGNWFEQRGKRDQIILATKVAGPAQRINWLRDTPHRLDRKNIVAACEASLKRLKTDYIDLYQLHWPNRSVNIFGQRNYKHNSHEEPVDLLEAWSAMGELVQTGKVREIGVSNETPWGLMQYQQLAKEHHLPAVVSTQNCYNLLNRLYEVGASEVSHRENIGLLAYSPLAGGLLSGKYRGGAQPEGSRLVQFKTYFDRYSSPVAHQAVDAYATLAENYNLSLTQLALAFVTSRPFVSSTIIGATSMEQLKENIASAELVLQPKLLKELEAIHERYPNPCP